jgi:hypothetical protein
VSICWPPTLHACAAVDPTSWNEVTSPAAPGVACSLHGHTLETQVSIVCTASGMPTAVRLCEMLALACCCCCLCKPKPLLHSEIPFHALRACI